MHISIFKIRKNPTPDSRKNQSHSRNCRTRGLPPPEQASKQLIALFVWNRMIYFARYITHHHPGLGANGPSSQLIAFLCKLCNFCVTPGLCFRLFHPRSAVLPWLSSSPNRTLNSSNVPQPECVFRIQLVGSPEPGRQVDPCNSILELPWRVRLVGHGWATTTSGKLGRRRRIHKHTHTHAP